MNFPAAPRRAPTLKPLALATIVSLCFAAPASAQAVDQSIPSVLVTGARFASDPALQPIGATVITADQIRRAGVSDANQAIRKVGGVVGRQSLDGSTDFALDLRGFGPNSEQNMVIMVDGVRISESEMASTVLSTIPVDIIERIEISRGGSSVLYGEGATGGVIHIITRRADKQALRGSVMAEAGEFGLRDVRASVAQGFDSFAYDVAVGYRDTDNYRANNKHELATFSGGLQWSFAGGRAGVRLDGSRADSRFAGPLSMAKYLADPRQASSPDDFGSLDTDRLTTFAEYRIGAVELAAELSHRERTARATYISSWGTTKLKYEGKQTQFSPRARHLARFDGMVNELVGGIDLIRWNRVTDSSFSTADAEQDSKAIYVRNEIRWNAAHEGRLAIGARRELFDKEVVDAFAFPPRDEAKQGLTAWELQGSYRVVPQLNLFAKTGQSYRVANADDNGLRDTAGALKGQKSRDLELGATFGRGARQLTARAFRHELTDEIFYDPTAGAFGYGANVNLDPTRRQGFEFDLASRLGAGLSFTGHLQHVDAEFTAGPNAGRDVVLVPKNSVTARLSWTPASGHSADFGAQWIDEQRYGSDFDNTCAGKIPAYTLLDARYAVRVGKWELAVSGLNLADKKHYSQAYGCQTSIYPADGRQMKISARYDF